MVQILVRIGWESPDAAFPNHFWSRASVLLHSPEPRPRFLLLGLWVGEELGPLRSDADALSVFLADAFSRAWGALDFQWVVSCQPGDFDLGLLAQNLGFGGP